MNRSFAVVISISASISVCVMILPEGLWGELIMINLVRLVIVSRTSSQSILYSGKRMGILLAVPPARRMTGS